MISDEFITSLYQESYCAKEAGAMDDFLNWLRRLFGLKHVNTTGENLANVAVFGGSAAGATYGLKKVAQRAAPWLDKTLGYYTEGNRNNALRDAFKAAKGQNGEQFRAAFNTKFDQRMRQLAPVNKAWTWAKNLPKGGKWGLIAAGGLTAAAGATKLYDSLFNN